MGSPLIFSSHFIDHDMAGVAGDIYNGTADFYNFCLALMGGSLRVAVGVDSNTSLPRVKCDAETCIAQKNPKQIVC